MEEVLLPLMTVVITLLILGGMFIWAGFRVSITTVPSRSPNFYVRDFRLRFYRASKVSSEPIFETALYGSFKMRSGSARADLETP
ncbi:MAG: hypothetical protein AAGH60_14345 [Pseudomonadota bacterium]